MDRLDEIRERCEAATPGPWFSHESHNWHKDPPKEYFIITRGMREVVASWVETSDAQFIAHAREDIPWLLAMLDEMKG